VWAVHEKKVIYWNELANNSYITAVAFTQDASMVAVGTFTGDLIFYLFVIINILNFVSKI
jgi:hypothetical protein